MSVEKFAKILLPQAEHLGEQGVEKLAQEMSDQADKVDEPWQRALINLAADGIAKFGPDGVKMASQAVEDLLDGKRGTKISDITDDLETASDLLYALQNAEAARKSKARDFMRVLGQSLGRIAGGFLKGLL